MAPALAAAQLAVLAHDDGVEVLGRDLAELDDVLVAAVAGGRDDGEAAVPHHVGPRVAVDHEPVDEVAHRPHAVRVVAVVDEHRDPADDDLVEPARREVVGRRERTQPLPDVVQRRAGGEGGRRPRPWRWRR